MRTALLALLAVAVVVAAPAPRVLVLGGTGRIGTACVTHMLRARCAPLRITIAGRRAGAKSEAALAEIMADARLAKGSEELSFRECDWRDPASLAAAVAEADAVVHTAGAPAPPPLPPRRSSRPAPPPRTPAHPLTRTWPRLRHVLHTRLLSPQARLATTRSSSARASPPGLRCTST